MCRISARIAGLVLVVLLAVSACGGSGPSKAECKKALKAQYATTLATGQQGKEPAECKGLSAAVIQQLVGEVISGQ